MDDEARRLNDCRIGAADDLYDALVEADKALHREAHTGPVRDQIDAALARADGRT
jgi:hypothetical protein